MTFDSPIQRANVLAALEVAAEAVERRPLPWHERALQLAAFAQTRAAVLAGSVTPTPAEAPTDAPAQP